MSGFIQWATTPIGPDLPAPVTVLVGLAIFAWEHWLAETDRTKATSTIGLVLGLLKRKRPDEPPTNLNHPGPPALLALVAVASLSACAPAWQTGAALVASAHVAVKGYQAYTHDARRAILAASGCHDVPACESALAPFEAKQAPVLACLEALSPLVDAAAIAAEAKDAKAAAVVVPDLAAKVPICVVEIQKAKR